VPVLVAPPVPAVAVDPAEPVLLFPAAPELPAVPFVPAVAEPALPVLPLPALPVTPAAPVLLDPPVPVSFELSDVAQPATAIKLTARNDRSTRTIGNLRAGASTGTRVRRLAQR
jgi:hypothetical protein